MNGIMILFQFPEKTDHGTINKFMQKFYGQDSTSWNGKYRYHRDFLGDYSLTCHVREVKLTPEDEEKLRQFLSFSSLFS